MALLDKDIYSGSGEPLKDVITNIDILLGRLKEVGESAKLNLSEISKNLRSNKGKSYDELKALLDSMEESNKLKMESIAIEKQQIELTKAKSIAERELLKLAKDKESAQKRENNESAKSYENYVNLINKWNEGVHSLKDLEQLLKLNREAYSKLNKEERENSEIGKNLLKNIKEQAKAQDELRSSLGQYQQRVGSYKEALAETNDKLKMLILKEMELKNQHKTNTKEYSNLQKEIKSTTNEYKQQYAAVNQLEQRLVGLTRNRNFIGSQLSGIGSQLGIPTNLGDLATILKGVVQKTVEFEKQMSNLKAMTDLTKEQLLDLSNSALDMGAKFGLSSKDVVEAFKLIVGAMPELQTNSETLKDFTEQVLILSKASGLDMPESAKRLTDAMNQFKLPAKEAANSIDILASGAKAGSAEIPQITDALLAFGAVAKSGNISLKESVALIETLATTKKGAEAGVGIRNIMLKMADAATATKEANIAYQKYGINTKLLTDTSVPFITRLKELSKVGKDSAAIMSIFGTENAVAASVILNSIKDYEKYTEKLNDTGIAAKMAADNMNNAAGDIQKMGGSWDRFILNLTKGEGVFSSILRDIVQSFKTILDSLNKINTGTFSEKIVYGITLLNPALAKTGDLTEKQAKNVEELEKSYSNLFETTIKGISRINQKTLGFAFEDAYRDAIKKIFEVANIQADVARKENSEKEKKALEKQLKDIEEFQQKRLDLLKKYGLISSEELLKIELKLIESYNKKGLLDSAETLAAKKNFWQKYYDDLAQMAGDSAKVLEEIQKDSFNSTTDLSKSLSDYESQLQEEKMLRLQNDFDWLELNYEDSLDKQLELLEAQKKDELNQENLSYQQKRAIQIKYDKFEQDLLEERGHRELELTQKVLNTSMSMFYEHTVAYKAAAAAQATIDTWGAANKALNQPLPLPLKLIEMALVIATGLTNVANITGISLKGKEILGIKFEKGEVDIKGKRHSEGGVIAEIEGGESVINRTGTKNAKNALKLINDGKLTDKEISIWKMNFHRNLSTNFQTSDSKLAEKLDKFIENSEKSNKYLSNLGYSYPNKDRVIIKKADGTSETIV